MLHAPTTESKKRNGPASTNAGTRGEHELHPSPDASVMPGWEPGAGGQSAQREHFAGLQRTAGNQVVLRMLAAGSVGRNQGVSPRLQAKLAINEPGDVYEQEADRVAEAVISQPGPAPAPIAPMSQARTSPTIQRKCACGGTCAKRQVEQPIEERKTLQMKNAGAAAPAGIPAPPIVHEVLRSQGQPLDQRTRNFLEPRFGSDFSKVRVHTGTQAAESAKAVNALAYTVGSHVVFDDGLYQPHGTKDRLLAHELAHVVQQEANLGTLRRKLAVTNPAAPIPDPTGSSLKQTNKATIQNYLQTLCTGGQVTVAPSGDVQLTTLWCETPGMIGGTSTPTGCGCICDIVVSKNQWKIKVDDRPGAASWPHTDYDNPDAASGKTPGGSGGTVTVPSPNSPNLWGEETVSGRAMNVDPWLLLGHELCGHAWLDNRGAKPPDVPLRGEGGHQEAVQRENLLHKEHGLEERGSFKDPYCGESFWTDKATPRPVPNYDLDVMARCATWRDAYNLKNATNYRMWDKIP